MKSPCPCGGETRADYFDHPRLTDKWFLRCTVCDRKSAFVSTEEETDDIQIEAEPCQ